MSGECKTICVNCRHHYLKPDSRGIDVWYLHFCHHPEVSRPREQDPVTGKWGYADKNDLGKVSIGNDQFPHCNEINHGNCELYEEKADA